MFCKHCGKQIADDSSFCQYCGGKQSMEASSIDNAPNKPNNSLNVNGNINFSNNESLLNRIIKFSSKNSSICLTYAVWFVLNIILLVCGSNSNGFFPRIYKDYHWRDGNIGEWAIEWEIENYGWVEFIIYVILLPLLIYVGYILYNKIQRALDKPFKFNPSEGLRRD